MPTEKNAAFLPMQYSFKLDRQSVKVNRGIMYLTMEGETDHSLGSDIWARKCLEAAGC